MRIETGWSPPSLLRHPGSSVAMAGLSALKHGECAVFDIAETTVNAVRVAAHRVGKANNKKISVIRDGELIRAWIRTS